MQRCQNRVIYGPRPFTPTTGLGQECPGSGPKLALPAEGDYVPPGDIGALPEPKQPFSTRSRLLEAPSGSTRRSFRQAEKIATIRITFGVHPGNPNVLIVGRSGFGGVAQRG